MRAKACRSSVPLRREPWH